MTTPTRPPTIRRLWPAWLLLVCAAAARVIAENPWFSVGLAVTAVAIGVLTLWYRQIGVALSRTRPVLALVLSVSGVFTAAAMQNVMSDWFPQRGQQYGGDYLHSTPWRVWLTAGGLIVVATSAALLTWSRRTNGTLYYFRMVIERAPDLHETAQRRARKRALAYRSVSRSLSLGDQPWADAVAAVAGARADLERAFNDGATSYTQELAPNAHWPIAFSLGFEWPLPDDATIVEFDDATGAEGFAVSARLPDFLDDVPFSPPNASIQLVHVDVHFSRSAPVSEAERVQWMQTLFRRGAGTTIAFGHPRGPQDCGCYKISSPDLGPADADGRRPVTVGSRSAVTPWHAATVTAQAIVTALDVYPCATVAVSARIPKAVAVLAGRYFAGYLRESVPPKPFGVDQNSPAMQAWSARSTRSSHLEDPWRRLVLLNFNGPLDRMQALRVRDRQPWVVYPAPTSASW